MPKHIKNLLLLIVFLTVAFLDFTWINRANQTYAKKYLNESIVLAATTYGTCRIINGGVSSFQESSISISPWGIGVEYEAGQILDPINDATERLSELCVKSMAILGVQRLLLSAVNTYTIIPFYILLSAFLLLLSFFKTGKVAGLLGRWTLFLFLLRLSAPLMCLIGTQIDQKYIIPKVREQEARLVKVKEIAMQEFETTSPSITMENSEAEGKLDAITQFLSSFIKKIGECTKAIQNRTSALAAAIVYMKDNFSDISESLAMLFVLLVEKIALQVFLLPLGLLYGLKKIYAWLTGDEFAELLRPNRAKQ